MLESLKNKFQLRFKNRVFAAKILAGALEDALKKIKINKKKDSLILLSIARRGVIVGDIVATKLSLLFGFSSYLVLNYPIQQTRPSSSGEVTR